MTDQRDMSREHRRIAADLANSDPEQAASHERLADALLRGQDLPRR